MIEIQKQLSQWRKERNITTFPLTIKDDLLSELQEVKQAQQELDWSNYVEELADIAIFAFNGLGLLFALQYKRKAFNVEANLNQLESYINNIKIELSIQTYTILCHIITICDELVTAKRYDFKKVVLEKIKVISSRKQNPVQKKIWAKNGASSKWEKMKDQPKETLYVGNYGKCKI
jgi:hypothetical protein